MLGIALLAGISGGILSAAVWARNTIRAQDDRAAAQTATTYPNPVDCTADDLDVTLTSPESVGSGEGMTLNVTVNNTGSEACLLDLGGEHIGAVVTSGTQTIWESTVCPFTPTSRRLLVAPGDDAAATIIWDGNVASSDCAPAAVPTATATASASATATAEATADATDGAAMDETGDAQGPDGAGDAPTEETPTATASGNVATAGTYRVRIQLDGSDLTEDRVFVIE
ncbi:hypothetical protein [Actinomyces ruminicola]|uniref:DUF4232 domain-containing protein n=1 Tax=Actinomyces ruminicola TaxID=332524 RepID=A0A1H0AGX5_9ACTO|nr:hypothetical protein [Actinomyces ruminicola]SDN32634.1 hypothetical protein SAMN04487766_12510 [Actinomyces ruminicola]